MNIGRTLDERYSIGYVYLTLQIVCQDLLVLAIVFVLNVIAFFRHGLRSPYLGKLIVHVLLAVDI